MSVQTDAAEAARLLTDVGSENDMLRTAFVSADGRYRWTLNRIWGNPADLLVWIMLNPSTADASVDDPTIRRCIGFARGWGYDGITVVNLFAWRATDPAALTAADDPIGRANDRHIADAVRGKDVVAAWGASVPQKYRHRPEAVRRQLTLAGVSLHHLGLTKTGAPRHPLYLRGDTQMTRWGAA